MKPERRRKGTVVLLLTVVLAALGPTESPAFKPETHALLTEQALQAANLKTASGTGVPVWEFHSKARADIAAANEGVDGWNLFFGGTLGGIVPLTADHHFDDSLADGAARLHERRVEILSKLRQADYIGMNIGASSLFESLVDDARTELGRALHAVQDFYSHSSWVDRGNSRPVSGLGEDPSMFTDVTGACSCGSAPTTLVTGWFRLVPTDTIADTIYAPMTMIHDASVGRCIHGAAGPQTPVVDSLLQLSCPHEPDYPVLPGIAKDEPDHPLFPAAAEQALIASAGFTQGILRELYDGGYLLAMCAFLGYQDSRSCFAKEEGDTTVVELPFARFSIDAYKTDEAFTLDIPLFDPSLGELRGMTTKWRIKLDGVASCPNPPSTVDSRANLCLAWRRIANLQISSPDIGQAVGLMRCETLPESIQTMRCGFGSDFLPDNFGLQLYRWPGGSYTISETFEKEYRVLTGAPELLMQRGGPSTFRVDATITTRMLFFLGISNGPGLEPSSILGSGTFLSFDDAKITIDVSVAYEYVKEPDARLP